MLMDTFLFYKGHCLKIHGAQRKSNSWFSIKPKKKIEANINTVSALSKVSIDFKA